MLSKRMAEMGSVPVKVFAFGISLCASGLVPFCLGRNGDPLLPFEFGCGLLDIQRREMVEESPGPVFGLEFRQNGVDQLGIGLSGLLRLRDILPQRRDVVVEVVDVGGSSYISVSGNES